jgi:cytoplasmic iron level regulating protein YaaA (DUF328/UPF0246 family)
MRLQVRVRARARPWKTFLEKSFPTFQKNFHRNRYAVSGKGKSKGKTLENFFGKKFSKPFKKLSLKPLRGFRIKSKGKGKTLENFFEKKFSKPFKKLSLKPLRGFRIKSKSRGKGKTLGNFFRKKVSQIFQKTLI